MHGAGYTHRPEQSSGAAKPALSARPSEDTSLTLSDVIPMLQDNQEETWAQKLLEHIPVLQRWQKAERPRNADCDAMTKLGSLWDVKQKVGGKKRPPADVAEDLEKCMLKKAKEVIGGGVAKPEVHDKKRSLEDYFMARPSQPCANMFQTSKSPTDAEMQAYSSSSQD